MSGWTCPAGGLLLAPVGACMVLVEDPGWMVMASSRATTWKDRDQEEIHVVMDGGIGSREQQNTTTTEPRRNKVLVIRDI